MPEALIIPFGITYIRVKVRISARGRLGSQMVEDTIWIGPFSSVEKKNRWRSVFQVAIGRNTYLECGPDSVKEQTVPLKTSRMIRPEIHSDTDPFVAAESLPRIIRSRATC